jgi:hypothetical protein
MTPTLAHQIAQWLIFTGVIALMLLLWCLYDETRLR